MVKTLPQLETSPRTLMPSLRYYRRSRSPSDEMVIRSNDLAVMEILRERKAAIESGKLKGRRLFEELEGWNNNGLQEDCEVMPASVTTSCYDSDDGSEGKLPAAATTYSSSSCAPMGVHVAQMKQGEKKVVRRIVVLVLVGVALVICATGITSMWRYRDEYEVTLVPT